MRDLLKRFCETGLDQWENWRTETSYGTVYITIQRIPAPGATDESYDPF